MQSATNARKRARVITGKRTKLNLGAYDWTTLFIVLGLLLFGVLMVFDASYVDAFTTFGDKFHFVKLQALWGGIGLVSMAAAMVLPLNFFRKYARPFFVFTLFLLLIVIIPGIGTKIYGARRWLILGAFRLQPSELAKVAAVLYMPAWLVKHQRLGPFLTMVFLLLGLIMLEPDLGTAVIITSISFAIYFFSGASLKRLMPIGLAMALFGVILIISSPYRLKRVTTFLDPTSDPLGDSYHIRQVLLSFGSGGMFGTGIGRSRQKFQYLPEASTDSIFAVIAEETGFVGGTALIAVYAFLLIRAFSVVNQIKDPYAQLVGAGVTTWLTLQTLLNLSAMVVLVPLTGVPLPFVSYGGSALITNLIAVGLLLNASRYRTELGTITSKQGRRR